MNKKTLTIIAILIVFISAALTFVISNYRNKKLYDLTDEQIRKKFECSRKTEDYRATDAYCKSPTLFRQHVKEGKILEKSDFYRLSEITPAE